MTQKLKTKNCTVKLFLVFAFYSLFNCLSAQSVSAGLDRDKILLGEQVTLKLSMDNINSSSFFVTVWPQLQDTINHAEILKTSFVDTININGFNSYQQNFTLTGFDSGKWQLGPFTFVIQDKATGKKINLLTPSVYLTVLPVDVSALKDYHPLKDVIEVASPFNWLPVIIIAGAVISIAIIFLFLKRRKRKVIKSPKIVVKGTPLERAVGKLQQLRDQRLNSAAEIKKIHSDIDMICREYFEEMFNIKALQSTAPELFSRMNVYMQDVKLRSQFHQIFEVNGAVKFAKYLPSSNESKTTLNEIMHCLTQIDVSAQQAKNNADRMVSKY